MSSFQNAKNQVVLKKETNEKKTNLYTNTRSFAEKFARRAPKHKIKRVDKTEDERPQIGYYDSMDAFNRNCGPRIKNCVNMDKDLPRDDKHLMVAGMTSPSLMKSKIENQKKTNVNAMSLTS